MIFSFMSCNVNKQTKTVITKEVSEVNTLTNNEENPYDDATKTSNYQSQIFLKENYNTQLHLSLNHSHLFLHFYSL